MLTQPRQIELITSADAALKRHERESGERSKSLRREAKHQIEQLGNVTRCEKIRSASERSGPSGSDARGSPATTAADAASKARAHASQGKRDGGSSDSLKELMEPTNPQWLRVCTNWLPAAHNVTRWGPSHVRARVHWVCGSTRTTRTRAAVDMTVDVGIVEKVYKQTHAHSIVCAVLGRAARTRPLEKNHDLLSEIYFSAGEVRAPVCVTVEPLLLHTISILKQVRTSGVRYLDVDTSQDISRKMQCHLESLHKHEYVKRCQRGAILSQLTI